MKYIIPSHNRRNESDLLCFPFNIFLVMATVLYVVASVTIITMRSAAMSEPRLMLITIEWSVSKYILHDCETIQLCIVFRLVLKIYIKQRNY